MLIPDTGSSGSTGVTVTVCVPPFCELVVGIGVLVGLGVFVNLGGFVAVGLICAKRIIVGVGETRKVTVGRVRAMWVVGVGFEDEVGRVSLTEPTVVVTVGVTGIRVAVGLLVGTVGLIWGVEVTEIVIVVVGICPIRFCLGVVSSIVKVRLQTGVNAFVCWGSTCLNSRSLKAVATAKIPIPILEIIKNIKIKFLFKNRIWL